MIKSRFSYLKWTAVVAVLAITIIAGVLLVYGYTNPPQSKFSVRDATTREANGKLIRAKPGFELVRDGNHVSARRLSKPTESSNDEYYCMCPSGTTGVACHSGAGPNGGYTCDGECSCSFQRLPK